MIIRELSAGEFVILESVHDGFTPDPKTSIAFIAEDQGQVIGRIFLMAPTHAEGPWIREDHRGGTLAIRLMNAAESKARAVGIKKMFAYATDETIAGYMSRLGYKQEPWTVWTKEL